jgi:hypothetical protein
MNMHIPAPKIGDLQIGPKTQNADFLENNCLTYSNLWRLPKYNCIHGIVRKIMLCTVLAQP